MHIHINSIDKENNNRVPELRFPGFTGEWVVKKLGEVFTRITRKNNEDNRNILTISAQYGLVSQTDFFNKSVAAADVTGYYLLERGDFAYNKSSSSGNPMGVIKPLKKYEKGVVSTLYICINCNEPKSISFWEQYFNAGCLDSEIRTIAQEGARNHGLLNVSTSDFFTLKVLAPTLAEQQKIADCLSSLDEEIAAEAQKADALKDHKKGLMQQLFPAISNEQLAISNCVPKRRFPGFEGEWVVKKLGEIAEKVNSRNRDKSETRVLTNSATEGVVDQNDYFDRDIAVKENTDNYHIVEINDFVYNPRISSSAPVGPISRNKIGKGIMSPLYTVFRFKSEDINFLEHFFNTTIWHKYLKSVANYGARFDRMAISTEDFYSMPILLPTLAEQQKIADCLSELDEMISAQQQKVEALKEHKKGLMQKLFPKMSN